MKVVLKLDGLCCANCAAKIESTIKKLDGVESADLSFMTCKLILEVRDDVADNIISECEHISKKIEPDVKVNRIK